MDHEQKQAEKITVKKEISAEETTANAFIFIDCPICGENVGDQSEVSCHVETIHQMTMCTNCGRTFVRADQLNDHKLTCPQHLKHVNSKFSSEGIPQPQVETLSSGLCDTVCPHCDKDCLEEALLACHITWFHQPFVCVTCGITVSGKHRIKYHKRKYHSEPTFKCPHCSKKFHWKKDCLRHVSKHVKDSKFPCQLCGRKYKNALAVKDHVRRMHSSKEYQFDPIDSDELKPEPQLFDDTNLLQRENVELKMEIKVEDTTLQEQDYQTPDEDRVKSPTISKISTRQPKAQKIHTAYSYKESSYSNCINENCLMCIENCLHLFQLTCLQHQKHVDSQFSSEEIPESHVEASSNGLSDTVCPHCDKDCFHEALLARHIVWFHQPIVCVTCGITVSGKHRIRYHKKKHHAKPKYECPHCSKKFHWKNIYLRHVSTHVKDSMFPCKLCGRKYKHAFAVKDHVRRMHSSKEYQTDRNGCNELDQELQPSDEANLLQGENMELKMEIKVEETTLQEQDYQSPDEDSGKSPAAEPAATIISKSQLKARKIQHWVNPKFSCSKCHQTFHQIRAFQTHVYKHVHMEKKRFQCKICNRQLKNRRKLRSHMAIEHEPDGMQCKCPICGVTLSSFDKLRYHKVKYHTEKKFKCPHCPRKFIFEKVALAHMRIHKSYRTKRLILLKLHTQHRHGDNTKGADHEKEVKIKDELLRDNSLTTPQSSAEASEYQKTDDQMVSCSICGDIFENKRNMKYHKQVSHTEPKYKCSSCPLTFHFGARLRNHEKVHKKEISCILCSKKFQDELCLQSHLTNDHSCAELLCNKCNLKFTSHQEYNYHMERFHTEPRFKCPDCGKLYHVEFALRNHMAIHSKTKRKKLSTNKDIVDGDFAQNQSSSLQNVESEHLDHGNEIEIKDEDQLNTCPICELVFDNNRRLKYHELVIHTEPQHKCSQCPKMFHFIYSQRRHEATHTKTLEAEGSVMCDLCTIRFPDKSSLQRHISNAHPPSKMSCDKCDLMFTTRYKLNYHERKFHSEGGFKCPYCEKVYIVEYTLRRHMAVHLKEKQKRMKEGTEMADQQIVESESL